MDQASPHRGQAFLTAISGRPNGGKLLNCPPKLTNAVEDAGHVGVREFCLTQHEATQLLMAFGKQIDLRIDLRRQNGQ